MEISDFYGEKQQLCVFIDKLKHLQMEIDKILNNSGDLYNFIDKVADVDLVIDQLIYVYDIKPAVDYVKKNKLEEIKNKMNINN